MKPKLIFLCCSNLHQSILGALAANLASSSNQDDLSLLTDSFSSLEPVTNGVVNGVLSRLGATSIDEPAAELIVRIVSLGVQTRQLADYRGTCRPISKWRASSPSPSTLSGRSRLRCTRAACCSFCVTLPPGTLSPPSACKVSDPGACRRQRHRAEICTCSLTRLGALRPTFVCSRLIRARAHGGWRRRPKLGAQRGRWLPEGFSNRDRPL